MRITWTPLCHRSLHPSQGSLWSSFANIVLCRTTGSSPRACLPKESHTWPQTGLSDLRPRRTNLWKLWPRAHSCPQAWYTRFISGLARPVSLQITASCRSGIGGPRCVSWSRWGQRRAEVSSSSWQRGLCPWTCQKVPRRCPYADARLQATSQDSASSHLQGICSTATSCTWITRPFHYPRRHSHGAPLNQDATWTDSQSHRQTKSIFDRRQIFRTRRLREAWLQWAKAQLAARCSLWMSFVGRRQLCEQMIVDWWKSLARWALRPPCCQMHRCLPLRRHL